MQIFQVIVSIVSLTMLILGSVAFLLLRKFFAVGSSHAEASEPLEISWNDYHPLGRLLDPADFEFLRRHGVSEFKIMKFRVQRRKIYRLCLHRLARDFNDVHRYAHLVLIQSHVDRPELAAELAKQKLTFHRNLLRIEFRLTLHACGIERMPAIDLLQPVAAIEAQLRELAVSRSDA
jgi:hypothetical protein